MGATKVYLLLLGDGDYTDAWVDSVWSTREKAEVAMSDYLSNRTLRDTPSAAIEEWDVK